MSEGLDSLLDCLRQSVKARGIPIRLYVDNGKVFHSQQLARIAASLGILIVHSPPYQPEGRGKIERWFRTVRDQSLANLDRKQTLTLESFSARFWAWIDNGYHVAEHRSLGATPLLRWQRDIEQIRQIPPATDVRRLFFYRVIRTVRCVAHCLCRFMNRCGSALPCIITWKGFPVRNWTITSPIR